MSKTNTTDKAANRMFDTLYQAARQFRFYEQQHLAKTPPDSAKAKTNADWPRTANRQLMHTRRREMADDPQTTAIFHHMNARAAFGVLACGYIELMLGQWLVSLILACLLIVQLLRCMDV